MCMLFTTDEDAKARQISSGKIIGNVKRGRKTKEAYPVMDNSRLNRRTGSKLPLLIRAILVLRSHRKMDML